MIKVCVVGDIHITVNNLGVTDKFKELLLAYIDSTKPDLVVVLGDTLDRYGYERAEPCLLYTSPSPRD